MRRIGHDQKINLIKMSLKYYHKRKGECTGVKDDYAEFLTQVPIMVRKYC